MHLHSIDSRGGASLGGFGLCIDVWNVYLVFVRGLLSYCMKMSTSPLTILG